MSADTGVYIEIIDAVLAEHPQLIFGDSADGSNAPMVRVQITKAYQAWLTHSGKDVCYIASLSSEHFFEGQDAVQHLVLSSVHIVKQMLAKGVEPHVAIGLLPSEIASRVHYIYWNTHT